MSFGGKKNYAAAYAKFKPSYKDFGKYVDSHTDLKAAWKQIQDDPNHWKSKYWIQRGATSKEAFGRAHAAEDAALKGGTYMGATKYKKGNTDWKSLWDAGGTTRFGAYLAGRSGADWRNQSSSDDGNGDGNGGRFSGGGKSHNMVAMQDYTAPAAKNWSGLSPSFAGGIWGSVPDIYGSKSGLTAFQPWSEEAKKAVLPTGLMSYVRPTLKSWEVPGTQWVDWAPYQERLDELQRKEDEENSDDDDDDDVENNGGNNGGNDPEGAPDKNDPD